MFDFFLYAIGLALTVMLGMFLLQFIIPIVLLLIGGLFAFFYKIKEAMSEEDK